MAVPGPQAGGDSESEKKKTAAPREEEGRRRLVYGRAQGGGESAPYGGQECGDPQGGGERGTALDYEGTQGGGEGPSYSVLSAAILREEERGSPLFATDPEREEEGSVSRWAGGPEFGAVASGRRRDATAVPEIPGRRRGISEAMS